MDQDWVLYGGLVVVALVVVVYIIFWVKEKRPNAATADAEQPDKQVLSLRLQAYERLVILTERLSLPSLLTRVPAGELTVRPYQALLTQQIKSEFEYNLSQQIYVSHEAWQAVSNLKEQNIYLINNLGATMPEDARGADLARLLMDLLNADPQASLHPIVLDALNFEARKLM
jgi:hypothetical protein